VRSRREEVSKQEGARRRIARTPKHASCAVKPVWGKRRRAARGGRRRRTMDANCTSERFERNSRSATQGAAARRASVRRWQEEEYVVRGAAATVAGEWWASYRNCGNWRQKFASGPVSHLHAAANCHTLDRPLVYCC